MNKVIEILDKNNIEYNHYENKGISIFGDCFDIMQLIPDNHIDLICSDNPYNIGIAKWDKIDNYIEWMGVVFKKWENLLKDNGNLYWFHSDMNQVKDLMKWLEDNTKFVFNSFINWYKENFRALSWKNPSEENNLRSWFNVCEFILLYTFQDSTGLQQIEAEFIAPRNPFSREIQKGMTKYKLKEMDFRKLRPSKNGNLTGWCSNIILGSSNPIKNDWELIETIIKSGKEYEDLRKEYEDLRYTHNLDKNHNNVWFSQYRNSGENHQCEKPDDIIDRIIKCSSHENDVVLDSFAGSHKTAIRCIMLDRQFITIEKDKNHYNNAQKEIKKIISFKDNKFYLPKENTLFQGIN